jgi:hypothetical protein
MKVVNNMKQDTETIEQIKRLIVKINYVYDEKFEAARMNFEMIGDEISLFLDNGNYTVNLFIGSPDEAIKFLSFHCGCVRALEYLF